MNQTDERPQWVKEFGAEYAVPDVLAKHPAFEDVSWRNDAQPFFRVKDTPFLSIAVDHPEPDKRYLPALSGKRFHVLLNRDHCGTNRDLNDPVAQLIEDNRFLVCMRKAGVEGENYHAFSTDDVHEAIAKALELVAMPGVEELAKAFCGVIRQRLDAGQLAEVNARNLVRGNQSSCATHDFCDANDAMSVAWGQVSACQQWVNRPEDSSEEESIRMQDEQNPAIDAAWGMARKANFNL